MRTIKCQRCGKEVEAKNNFQRYCRECAKEKKAAYDKEWRENNREHLKEYRENNKEKIAKRMKEWRENNKEHIKEYCDNNKENARARSKEWYENNKDRARAKNKEWRDNNKEKIAERHKEWYENNYIHADREGNNFCVYIHTDPLGKVYIGRAVGDDVKTVNRQRWQGGAGYQNQKFYNECIAVYGWDNIQHEIIEWNLTYEEVLEREQYWIERYNSRNPEYGYNVA